MIRRRTMKATHHTHLELRQLDRPRPQDRGGRAANRVVDAPRDVSTRLHSAWRPSMFAESPLMAASMRWKTMDTPVSKTRSLLRSG
jgi:hypothetical protein